MSPKELLYIEDALGHTEESKKCCTDFSNQVQDPALRTLLSDISERTISPAGIVTILSFSSVTKRAANLGPTPDALKKELLS